MPAWQSLHLFYAQPDHADELAVTIAGRLREQTSHHDDWFFIRYAEAGAHLRIRLGERIHPVYEAFRAQAAADCARLAEGVPVSGWVAAIGYHDPQGRVFQPGSVAEIAYVPETRRYGGPHALLENERLFRVSTGIAVRAIELTRTDVAKRARLAIDLMLMTAAAADCCSWSPGDFFSTYAFGWKHSITVGPEPQAARALAGTGLSARFDGHVAFLRSGQPPTSLVTHWGAAVREAWQTFLAMADDGRLISPISRRPPIDAAERSRAIAGLIYSQIHMMNNRLGFAPQAELSWSDALADHFGRHADPSRIELNDLRLSLGMPPPREPRDPAR